MRTIRAVLTVLSVAIAAPGLAAGNIVGNGMDVPNLSLHLPATAAPPAVHQPPPMPSPPVLAGRARPTRPSFPSHPRGWTWGGRSWWSGAYRPPMPGFVMPSFWLSPYYRIDDWRGWGLAPPGRGQNWVRYYDDAVLVDRRGVIRDRVAGLPWGVYARGPVPDYAGDDGYGVSPDDYGYADGDGEPRYTPRADEGYGYQSDDEGFPDDRVTWQDGENWATGRVIYAQSGDHVVVAPGTVTTIIVESRPIVTSVETTYYTRRH